MGSEEILLQMLFSTQNEQQNSTTPNLYKHRLSYTRKKQV